jgi:hypothetical protein
MKRTHVATVAAALVVAATALYFFGTDAFGLFSAANVAVLIAIGGLFIDKLLVNREDRLKGFAVKDERTRLLEGRAGRAAFLVGNYIWLALLWYEFAAENWMPWPKIGSPPVLLIGMLAQVAVYFVAMYALAKSVGR